MFFKVNVYLKYYLYIFSFNMDNINSNKNNELDKKKNELKNNKNKDNTHNKNEKNQHTIINLFKENINEILEQNQIYYSINQMNKYIQSPKHFKLFFNIKRKSLNIIFSLANYIRGHFVSSHSKDNLLQLYGKAKYSNENSGTFSKLLFCGICISLGLSYMLQRYKYRRRANTIYSDKSLKNEIERLKKQNDELIKNNKELISILNKKL